MLSGEIQPLAEGEAPTDVNGDGGDDGEAVAPAPAPAPVERAKPVTREKQATQVLGSPEQLAD